MSWVTEGLWGNEGAVHLLSVVTSLRMMWWKLNQEVHYNTRACWVQWCPAFLHLESQHWNLSSLKWLPSCTRCHFCITKKKIMIPMFLKSIWPQSKYRDQMVRICIIFSLRLYIMYSAIKCTLKNSLQGFLFKQVSRGNIKSQAVIVILANTWS